MAHHNEAMSDHGSRMITRTRATTIGGLIARTAAVLLVAFLISTHAKAENIDGVAVIIGNRSYGESVPAVEFAHNDADAMKEFVVNVLGYREGNIIDLRDATQAELFSAFGNEKNHKGKVWRLVRPSESDVVVFYSGHGVPGLTDRRGYLLPVNADPHAPELNGYPIDVLYQNLARIGARSVTVYIDACFSGDTPKGLLIRATSGISIVPRIPKDIGDLTILTAARGDQMASWDEEEKLGLFTRYLLNGLYGAADSDRYGNGDGQVTASEVKTYLDREMTYAARRNFGREQNATVLSHNNMVLASFDNVAKTSPASGGRQPLFIHRSHLETLRKGLEKEIDERDIRLEELLSQYDLAQLDLTDEQKISAAAKHQVELLNRHQVALRLQLASMQDALDASEKKSIEQNVKIVDLGKRLNLAIASKAREPARLQSAFQSRLKEELKGHSNVHFVDDRIDIQSELLFKLGSTDISAGGKVLLATVRDVLFEVSSLSPSQTNWALQIQGHTDTVPIFTKRFPNNWHLSTARALSVVEFLVSIGVPQSRLYAAGYGEFQPIDQRSDEIGNRRNRRIELRLSQR
jgi:flagellar motor protein MotB